MTRSDFIRTAGAAAVLSMTGKAFADGTAVPADYDLLQKEIDLVTPKEYAAYRACTQAKLPDGLSGFAALKRLDDAFDRVLAEVKTAVVTDRPAVWFVYNMGVIVKTRETCFSIDLRHRRATELSPILEFALITHNHNDHFTEEFYRAMNGAHKTVITNFKDNYGASPWNEKGGYTREKKVFTIKDVEIRTSLTDHNGYLVDFTTAFEVRVGDFVILHTGDCANVGKVNPVRRPDLWIVHPRCGTKVAEGVKKLNPRQTVIAHLNEMGHARDRWRWTYQDGLTEKVAAEAAGGKAIVPVWGDRIV